MLVGAVTRLNIPHESGEWIEVRQLSGLELDEASDVQVLKITKRLGSIDAATIDALRTGRDGAEAPAAQQDPALSYDAETLLKYAVVGWSYTQYQCDEQTKRLLDAVTLKWLVSEIVNMNVRPVGE